MLVSKLLFLLAFSTNAAETIHVVHYSDSPISAHERERLERITGAPLVVIPLTGRPLRKKRTLLFPGTVLHWDPAYDPHYLLGNKNPVLHAEKSAALLQTKRDERGFLMQFARSLCPETLFGDELAHQTRSSNPEADLRILQKEIQTRFGGDAILKFSDGFKSEGYLPRTNHDWAEIYRNYLHHTKPKIEQLRVEYPDATAFYDAILELPYVAGRVLEALLDNPKQIVAQKIVPKDYEVRVHVIEGNVLARATLLRYYQLGDYLTPEQVSKAESAIENELLKNLGENRAQFSASMDVIVGQSGIKIVDVNSGLSSGFYATETDLFIANLFVAHFKGEPTEYLKRLDAFEKTELDQKPKVLQALVRDFGKYANTHGASGFWDRVAKSYLRHFEESPGDPALFERVLWQLRRAGFSWYEDLHEFITEVQRRFNSRIPPERTNAWLRFINSLRSEDSLPKTIFTNGQFKLEPSQAMPCRLYF